MEDEPPLTPQHPDDQPRLPLSIHEDFHSFYEDRPFANCITCGESLADLDETYQITKSYHGDEVIMEFAMCYPCHENYISELSEKSVHSMMEFHMERSRNRRNLPDKGKWECEYCISTRSMMSTKKKHFSIAGICFGDEMIEHPIFVCEECLQEMQKNLSAQTRRRRDEFIQTNFPGVPSGAVPNPEHYPVLC